MDYAKLDDFDAQLVQLFYEVNLFFVQSHSSK